MKRMPISSDSTMNGRSCGPIARPTAGPSTSPCTARSSRSPSPFASRTHDRKVPLPGSSSGDTGRHSVCSWNGMWPKGLGRSGRGGGGRSSGLGTSGHRTSCHASSVSCAAPNTPCTRSATGSALPGTRRSAATCDARRPSRSTCTSISTGPGGTGARKMAFAVTSGRSGRPRVSCIARKAVYIVTPPNT
ncbi:MAG: hypothetical protein KatS3mg010_0921 [Acidimicrobiia bacterium]|nr:MAG: hypothetical protein KatS3mg010_0921 [Acidimicrobiia bacterium]